MNTVAIRRASRVHWLTLAEQAELRPSFKLVLSCFGSDGSNASSNVAACRVQQGPLQYTALLSPMATQILLKLRDNEARALQLLELMDPERGKVIRILFLWPESGTMEQLQKIPQLTPIQVEPRV